MKLTVGSKLLTTVLLKLVAAGDPPVSTESFTGCGLTNVSPDTIARTWVKHEASNILWKSADGSYDRITNDICSGSNGLYMYTQTDDKSSVFVSCDPTPPKTRCCRSTFGKVTWAWNKDEKARVYTWNSC